MTKDHYYFESFSFIAGDTTFTLLLSCFQLGGDLSTVLPYRKPLKRPDPRFDPPVVTGEVKIQGDSTSLEKEKATELTYMIARSQVLSANDAQEDIPLWGPFHANLQEESSDVVSTVAFNPIIMATSTDLSTVYTTLKRAKEAVNYLGQKHVPVFFDLGLLTKAYEITWARPEDLEGIIPCEGGMHLLMSIFSAIGYLYGDAGLKQLLHESGVYAAGSVQQMLTGKDFDRALRGLRMVDEALNKRFLLQFKKWCDETNHIIPPRISELLSTISAGKSIADVITQLTEVVMDRLMPLITLFREEGRSSSATFRLWDDFLVRGMNPLKVFLSTTRNGLWLENQQNKAEFLPLLFAANRTNYSRYLPVALLAANRLPTEVMEAFEHGNFVAKLSRGRFNAVWMDYTLEATENKALKGTGRIIGLTLRGPALARWFLARPVTAKYSTRFLEGICQASQKDQEKKPQHHGSGDAAKKRWNADVQKMVQMFDGAYIDFFELAGDSSTHLVNFATGAVAPKEVEENLVGALSKGATMAKTFIGDRLILAEGSDVPKKSLYDAIPRSRIKTMTDMRRKVKIRHKDVPIDGEVMYISDSWLSMHTRRSP